MAAVVIRVQPGGFDTAAETATLKGIHGVGAVVSFTGICRADNERLAALELEHYPGMVESEIRRIADEATERWALAGLTVVHRFGRIPVGDDIVLVATASAHRQAALESASFLMDYMKTRAPFWKREHHVDGSVGDWISAHDRDAGAAARWQKK